MDYLEAPSSSCPSSIASKVVSGNSSFDMDCNPYRDLSSKNSRTSTDVLLSRRPSTTV